jgi:signal peptidase I
LSDLIPPASEAPIEAAPLAPPLDPAATIATAPKANKALWREIVETVLLTVLIYAAVNFITDRRRIESVSMEPNLHPGEYVLVEKISYALGQPARGDVIVFHHQLGERDLIKRVIGLPGETVAVRNGKVWINETPLKEPYIAAPPLNGGQWTLGPAQYFVMGDNRNNSSDSRSWGPLERKFIVGKAVLIYWPLAGLGLVPHYTYAAAP